MKVALVTFFLSVFFYFSGPRDKRPTAFFGTKENRDSTFITVPFPLKMGGVSESFIKEKTPKIDSFYNKWIKSPYYSGGFIVAKNGRILYEDYQGYADERTKTPIDSLTGIHLASVSKVLTATAVLKLVENDNIMLDQKVTDWLPKFPYQDITIRMLLNHRSGLQPYSSFSALMKKNWDNHKVLCNQDILDMLSKYKFKQLFHTNTRFDYCNTNYVLLALIIERATGMNYRLAMQKLIFKPLGMKSTYVFNYDTDRVSASKSYKGSKQFAWDQFDALYGDKNIYSTPRDLVKFDLATYSPEFINQKLLQEAYYGYSNGNSSKAVKDYGLGMRMKFLQPSGEKMIFHNGWWHGNNTSFVPVRKDTITVVCLGNKFSNRPYTTLNMVSDLFYKKPKQVHATEIPCELELAGDN
jgi:CubicO group peptidase (beta-lactamase class C family)